MEDIIGLKELRGSIRMVERNVRQGRSYLVLRKSRPLFKIVPVGGEEERWETVIDFTKIRRGGVRIDDILSRL
ncbi:MAG: hypothetical protein Q7S84_00300 [bacterium]|nr:hypothetical protein [bacterium]